MVQGEAERPKDEKFQEHLIYVYPCLMEGCKEDILSGVQ